VVSKGRISEMSTKELTEKLATYRFLCDYFRRGQYPTYWSRLVHKVEEELRKRGVF
jgi:hypothetical protein